MDDSIARWALVFPFQLASLCLFLRFVYLIEEES
jgi:hypothetical protein